MEPHILAAIPSPTQNAWPVAGIPVHAYALCIIAGIIVSLWLTSRRWRQRGGRPGTVADIATWAVPFGLVGARLYHVVTDYELYFGPGKNPWEAFAVWQGGLGIWGAVAGGVLGGWVGCRRKGISIAAFADAAAPGIVLAQAIGRWGNWFNNELYGRPTDLPWGLTVYQIDPATFRAVTENGHPVVVGVFQPTFLYESLWCVLVAVLVLWADKRFLLGHGRAFALYVAAYTVGRAGFEYMRIDPAHHVLGLRLNDWTSIVVFAAAAAYLVVNRGKGREETVEPEPDDEPGRPGRVRRSAAVAAAADADDADPAEPDGVGENPDAEDPDEPEPRVDDELVEEPDAEDEPDDADKALAEHEARRAGNRPS
ncbi:MAG: prolipoprotein diacylglyceryl transferase [Streptosporangiales bacterium]|nr:prolipoprotein diacylglyceryl transferase [Streptosporangiales bacterium]MBO0891063.1 prolipoprotein diacylglyceryl transferase [Acidothermales bacterium]